MATAVLYLSILGRVKFQRLTLGVLRARVVLSARPSQATNLPHRSGRKEFNPDVQSGSKQFEKLGVILCVGHQGGAGFAGGREGVKSFVD